MLQTPVFKLGFFLEYFQEKYSLVIINSREKV